MSPKDARTLLTAVHVEASSMRGHLLTGASNGPSANRPVLHSKYRLGRFLYNKQFKAVGIRDALGIIHSTPAAIDRVLWNSRKKL
eukprot:2149317-Heterocapsa_arctica.AAC.1